MIMLPNAGEGFARWLELLKWPTWFAMEDYIMRVVLFQVGTRCFDLCYGR